MIERLDGDVKKKFLNFEGGKTKEKIKKTRLKKKKKKKKLFPVG